MQNTASHDGLIAVVAMTPNGTIGLDGGMPWKLGSDLRRFKRVTMGGILIMGRKTYDSIGRPLPGRRSIVITRNESWHADGVERAGGTDQALSATAGERATGRQAFVIGGAQIYRQMIGLCSEIWLTRVHSGVVGDTILDIDRSNFRVFEQTRHPVSPRDDVPTEFLRMARVNS